MFSLLLTSAPLLQPDLNVFRLGSAIVTLGADLSNVLERMLLLLLWQLPFPLMTTAQLLVLSLVLTSFSALIVCCASKLTTVFVSCNSPSPLS